MGDLCENTNASKEFETEVLPMDFRSTRFTPENAKRILHNRLLTAEKDVDISRRLRDNSANLINSTSDRTKTNFTNTTEGFRSRLEDIHTWADNLEKEIKCLSASIEHLNKIKGKLRTSLVALDECFFLTTDCLNARQRRFGEDLQQDDVEIQLLTELELINKHLELTKGAIIKVDDQIKKNREMKSNLEKAWSDKHEADLLDSEAGHLNTSSKNTQYYPGEARAWPPFTQSTPISWVQHAQDLISLSEKHREASLTDATMSENLLLSSQNDIIAQKDRVDRALMKRLDEYEAEKQELLNKLGKVCDEINQLEKSIEDLRKAKSAKEPYIKIVQTRLHLHNQRRNVENCRDQPQQLLINELQDLEGMTDQLERQIEASLEKLKQLQTEQLDLERQIHMKNASIQIDREHCTRHRIHFPPPQRLRGHGMSF